jgi:hypothetical protein
MRTVIAASDPRPHTISVTLLWISCAADRGAGPASDGGP